MSYRPDHGPTSASFYARIAVLWPLRHTDRRSELRTLVAACRAWRRGLA